MKRLFLLFFSALLCTAVSAHDFEVDGIYYRITSSSDLTVSVTYQGSSYNSAVYSGSVVIPEKVTYDSKEYSVTSIGNSAFYGCSGLTSINIPNSVTSIGISAFYDCSGLTSIDIPNSVTSIGNRAFYGCSGLTSVTIPNSVTSIGDWAFYACSGLTAVHITDLSAWCKIKIGGDMSNPTAFAQHLYLNGEEIKNLVIPDDVTSIGEYAFDSCSGLTSVTIPNSVTSIGSGAFFFCYALTSVTIPNSVTSIGVDAFYGCITLTAVHITDLSAWCKIQFVKDDTFGEYSNPTLYANHLYLNGEEITNLVIPDDVTSIGDAAFYGCSGLTSVTIPNSVTSIGESAFQYCSGLTSVTIPESCKTVPHNAFRYCNNLQELSLPSTCVACYDYSFNGCTSLKKINSQAETPPAVYANTFSNSIYNVSST